MIRFITHRNVISRLRNNHPNKSANQLVDIAKNAWKNDYDRDARRNWLENHPVSVPSPGRQVQIERLARLIGNTNTGIDPNSEAAMLRFVSHRDVIGRLQNNNPNKTLTQIVDMAKNAWKNDYANREARLNWLGNHNNVSVTKPKTRVVRKFSYHVVESVTAKIKRVLCASKSLAQLKTLAEDGGVSTCGTKKDICDRIALLWNAKGRPLITGPSKTRERTTICEKKPLKFLKDLAEEMRVSTSGTKSELCKRMASVSNL